MATSFAFISAGKLYVSNQGNAPRLVESEYAREMEARQEKARQRHGWKGENDSMMGAMPGAAVWGKQSLAASEPLRVECSAVARGPRPGEVTFALQVGQVGGLFDQTLADGNERRVVHRAQLRVEEMDRHPTTGVLVYAQTGPAGTMRLATKRAEDNNGREITEGDALDQAPSWVQGSEDKVTYQTAGLARNPQGMVMGLGPSVLQELDLRTGEVTSLLEDADSDLLLPHKLADGSLYFIQRPYEDGVKIHYGRLALDVVLLPVRLIAMTFSILNFVARISTGKPLTQAGDARAVRPDLRRMILWGRLVEDEKNSKRRKADEPRALVPDSWQLIRRGPDGSETVIGRSVLGYDIAADGSVLFTDGRTIQRYVEGGKTEKVLAHFPIEKMTVLD